MSWDAPGRAIGVVIHEQDGTVHRYARGKDDSAEAVWREVREDGLSPVSEDEASITTSELLAALTTSLQAPYVAPEQPRN
jgi:hypothetical protein